MLAINKLLSYTLVLSFFLAVVINSSGQNNSDARVSISGIEAFKSWLSHSWLKSYMAYDTIENGNGKVNLVLTLSCSNECTGKWNRMKLSFDSLSTMSFEDYLWNKANFHLELPRNLLKIQVFNETKLYETPCFYRGISYRDTLIIEKINCKDLGSQSSLNYEKFNPSFLMNKLTVPNIDRKASQILDTFYSKCKNYFESKDKNVKIIKGISKTNRLQFEVTNLISEVIKTGTIEKLHFTIICNFYSNHVNFETIVNGKYGSSMLKPVSDKGYNDMEDNFKPEFQSYVNEFTNKLIQWLK